MSLKDTLKNAGGKLVTQLNGEEVVDESTEKPAAPTPAENEVPAVDEEKVKKDLQKKKMLFVSIMAVILVIGIFFFLRSNAGSSAPQFNMLDWVTVETVGVPMNDHGEIEAKLDSTKIAESLTAVAAEGTSQEAIAAAAERVIAASTITLSQEDGLSNGDEVMITVEFDETKTEEIGNFEFIGGSLTYTVSGLSDAIVLDPFAPALVEVNVTGISGSATAAINVKSSAPYMPFMRYEITPTKGLSNGSIITMSINPNLQSLIEMGYAVPSDETTWKKEIVVSGLSETVTDIESIPAALINSMVSYAESNLYKSFSAIKLNETDIVEEPVISSIYFLDKVDKTNPYTNYFKKLEMTNAVMILGKFSVKSAETPATPAEGEQAPASQQPTRSYGGYYAYIFPNLVKDAEGNISYSRSMIASWPTNYQTELECLNWAKGEFVDFSITEMGSNTTNPQ